MVYGGIESGGTKWECAIGTGPDDVRAAATVPTTAPEETIGRVVDFFVREGPVDALGIGSFGPIDAHLGSPTWGYVTTTPKPGWSNTDVGQEIRRRLDVPVAFDTDVNAAALGEHRWGAGRGLRSLWYVTVGTGIGGGAIVDGKLLHGLSHPEFGHLRVPHDRDADPVRRLVPLSRRLPRGARLGHRARGALGLARERARGRCGLGARGAVSRARLRRGRRGALAGAGSSSAAASDGGRAFSRSSAAS
jgi:ROK family